jgi:hypothetical protein
MLALSTIALTVDERVSLEIIYRRENHLMKSQLVNLMETCSNDPADLSLKLKALLHVFWFESIKKLLENQLVTAVEFAALLVILLNVKHIHFSSVIQAICSVSSSEHLSAVLKRILQQHSQKAIYKAWILALFCFVICMATVVQLHNVP